MRDLFRCACWNKFMHKEEGCGCSCHLKERRAENLRPVQEK
jgi:hypothetical protein